MRPRFSPGTDEAAAAAALAPLLAAPASPRGAGRWALANDGEALERSFRFKTFARTWVCRVAPPPPGPAHLANATSPQDFMTAVSLRCKIHNHHPEWSNVRPLSCAPGLPRAGRRPR